MNGWSMNPIQRNMTEGLKIIPGSPYDEDIIPLIKALSEDLDSRFGNDGRNSFRDWEPGDPGYIFIKVNRNDEIVGCGAVRPVTGVIGEVKRMYSKYKRMGIGTTVLSALEEKAREAGYKELWLETRVNNTEACSFYLKQGYSGIENYGRYVNRPEAACFGKKLTATQ